MTSYHNTLPELFHHAGSYGRYALLGAFALWLLGIVFMLTKPKMEVRHAYLVACFLPAGLGVYGFITGFMSAFAMVGKSGLGNGFALLRAIGELVIPMAFGFTGSGVALVLSAFVLMRSKNTPQAL
jgi:hypothetical protein